MVQNNHQHHQRLALVLVLPRCRNDRHAATDQLFNAFQERALIRRAQADRHPIGASGTRVLVTLLNAMNQRQAKIGLASLCIGGGEAVAMAVELV